MSMVFQLLFKADGTQDVAQKVAKVEKSVEQMGKTLADRIGDLSARYLTFSFLFSLLKEGLARINAYTDGIMQHASAVKALADRYGIGIETLQAWGIAASQNGATAEDIGAAFKKLKLHQQELKTTVDTELVKAFWNLGVSMEDLRKKKPEDIFRQMAQYLSEVPSSAEQLTSAIAVMGQTADKVLPAMRDRFNEIAKAARDSGQVIPDNVIKRLSDLEDQMKASARVREAVSAPAAAGYQALGEKLKSGVLPWMQILIGRELLNMHAWDVGASMMAGGGGVLKLQSELAKKSADAEKRKPGPQQVRLPNGLTNADMSVAGDLENPRAGAGGGSGFGATDTLARIGLFRGGVDGASVARQSLRELQRMRAELVRLNKTAETVPQD